MSASAGTGKTVACLIGLLHIVDAHEQSCQALILCPTRHVAQYTVDAINLIGQQCGLRVALVRGGTSIADDLRILAQPPPPHIIVSTPGRMCDLIKKHRVSTPRIRIVVFDEADEIFGRGFNPQLEEIMAAMPAVAQVVVNAPTLPQ